MSIFNKEYSGSETSDASYVCVDGGVPTYSNINEELCKKIDINHNELLDAIKRTDNMFNIWGKATETTIRFIIMKQCKLNQDVNTRIREVDNRLNNDDKIVSTLNEYLNNYKNETDTNIESIKNTEIENMEKLKCKISKLYWVCGASIFINIIIIIISIL